MKVYETRPTKQAIVVRPEKGVQHYEVWVLEPRFIGTMDRLGTQRVVVPTEGRPHGLHFTNLATAMDFILSEAGEEGLSEMPSPHVKKRRELHEMRPRSLKLPGAFLEQFSAELFDELVSKDDTLSGGIGSRFRQALEKVYIVTDEDLRAAGMQQETIDELLRGLVKDQLSDEVTALAETAMILKDMATSRKYNGKPLHAAVVHDLNVAAREMSGLVAELQGKALPAEERISLIESRIRDLRLHSEVVEILRKQFETLMNRSPRGADGKWRKRS